MIPSQLEPIQAEPDTHAVRWAFWWSRWSDAATEVILAKSPLLLGFQLEQNDGKILYPQLVSPFTAGHFPSVLGKDEAIYWTEWQLAFRLRRETVSPFLATLIESRRPRMLWLANHICSLLGINVGFMHEA